MSPISRASRTALRSPFTLGRTIPRSQPEKIQTVIDDLRLVQAGYRLYYAVDPHEVFNFCFPLRSTDATKRSA